MSRTKERAREMEWREGGGRVESEELVLEGRRAMRCCFEFGRFGEGREERQNKKEGGQRDSERGGTVEQSKLSPNETGR